MIEAKIKYGTSGIYKITNVKDGNFYIGSSKDIRKRWDAHKKRLRDNSHHSRYMQRVWNKHGEDIFAFEVLLICETSELLRYEQYFLDSLKPKYNTAKFADASARGRKMPAKFIKKLSKRMLGNKYTLGRKRSKEECDSISKAHKGKVPSSKCLEKSREVRMHSWGDWTSSDGTIYKDLWNLKEFCRVHSLNYGNMVEVWKGSRKQHLGWMVYNGC